MTIEIIQATKVIKQRATREGRVILHRWKGEWKEHLATGVKGVDIIHKWEGTYATHIQFLDEIAETITTEDLYQGHYFENYDEALVDFHLRAADWLLVGKRDLNWKGAK